MKKLFLCTLLISTFSNNFKAENENISLEESQAKLDFVSAQNPISNFEKDFITAMSKNEFDNAKELLKENSSNINQETLKKLVLNIVSSRNMLKLKSLSLSLEKISDSFPGGDAQMRAQRKIGLGMLLVWAGWFGGIYSLKYKTHNLKWAVRGVSLALFGAGWFNFYKGLWENYDQFKAKEKKQKDLDEAVNLINEKISNLDTLILYFDSVVKNSQVKAYFKKQFII